MQSIDTRSKVSPRQNRSNRSTSGVRRIRGSNHQKFERRKHPELQYKNRNPTNKSTESRSDNRKNVNRKNARASDKRSDAPGMHAGPKEQTRKTRKIYRRKKVFRTWVLPAFFLATLGIIWVEHIIGKLIDLEDIREVYQDRLDDIREVYQDQLVDPWSLLLQDLNTSRILDINRIPPISPSFLANISYAPRVQCPPGQRRRINIHNPRSHSTKAGGGRLIPMIVHQQAKSRCLLYQLDNVTDEWAFTRWSYYMHDDDSRKRFFHRYCGGEGGRCEFPLLNQIATKCFQDTRSSLEDELWKFLILWVFGGVYADLDLLPVKFSRNTIGRYDDGFLLIDSDTKMLTTKIIAVSPRHPIMFYAIHCLLLNLLMEESSLSQKGTEHEHKLSGSYILSQAFQMFQNGYITESKIPRLSPGIFHGTMNRRVRLVVSEGLNIHPNENDDNMQVGKSESNLVRSIFRSENEKEVEYKKMGMEAHVEKDNSGVGKNELGLSCLNELHRVTDRT